MSSAKLSAAMLRALDWQWHRSNGTESKVRGSEIAIGTSLALERRGFVAYSANHAWIGWITLAGCVALEREIPASCSVCGHFVGLHNTVEGGSCFGPKHGGCACRRLRQHFDRLRSAERAR